MFPQLEHICSFRECLPLRERILKHELLGNHGRLIEGGGEDENTRELLQYQKY